MIRPTLQQLSIILTLGVGVLVLAAAAEAADPELTARVAGRDGDLVVVEVPDARLRVAPEMTGRLCSSQSVDGRLLDVCPAAFAVAEVGRDQVRVRITAGSVEGFGDELTAMFSASSDKGALLVRSNVPNDEVLLDGRPVGSTPLRRLLDPGVYAVRVIKDGWDAWEGDVTVTASQEVVASARLTGGPEEEVQPGDVSLDLVDRGLAALDEGRYDEAVVLFERLTELRPADDLGRRLLARAREERSRSQGDPRLRDLEAELDRAIERQGLSSPATQSLAASVLRLDEENDKALMVQRAHFLETEERAQGANDRREVGSLWEAYESIWGRSEKTEQSRAKSLRDLRDAARSRARRASLEGGRRGGREEVLAAWAEYRAQWPGDEQTEDLMADALLTARSAARTEAREAGRRAAEAGDRETLESVWTRHRGRWPEDPEAEGLLREHLQVAREIERQETLHRAEEAAARGEVGEVESLWTVHLREWPDDLEADKLSSRLAEEARKERQRARQARVDWVRIPTGSYRMGCTEGDGQCALDERYLLSVQVQEPFWLAKYETTNDQYRACVDDGVCPEPQVTVSFDDPERGSHPVEWVSWNDAVAFCGWLGGKLPIEAQWEWAAREIFVRVRERGRREILNLSADPTIAATGEQFSARYPWRATKPRHADSPSHQLANYQGRGGRDEWLAAAPVGSFPPNSRGLYDMAGNVAEWVRDPYGHHGTRPDLRDQTSRVVRGGHHFSEEEALRVSARDSRAQDYRNRGLGFRCALDTAPRQGGVVDSRGVASE